MEWRKNGVRKAFLHFGVWIFGVSEHFWVLVSIEVLPPFGFLCGYLGLLQSVHKRYTSDAGTEGELSCGCSEERGARREK